MAMFELAIPIVLRHEGGFNNVVGDPGGATNFGVSLRWLKSQGLAGDLNHDGDVDIADVKMMTQQDAEGFYRRCWWDKYNYGAILAQAVATKVFDMAVNLGAPRAHKIVQSVLGVVADGVLGPKTLNELNSQPSLKVILNLQNTQAQFYRDLVAANPARQKFLQGWLNSAYDRT